MKKLYRSISDRRLGGICGGLGEIMNVDPNILRVGRGLFLYHYRFFSTHLYLYCGMYHHTRRAGSSIIQLYIELLFGNPKNKDSKSMELTSCFSFTAYSGGCNLFILTNSSFG